MFCSSCAQVYCTAIVLCVRLYLSIRIAIAFLPVSNRARVPILSMFRVPVLFRNVLNLQRCLSPSISVVNARFIY